MEFYEIDDIKYPKKEVTNKDGESITVSTESLNKLILKGVQKHGVYASAEERHIDDETAYFVPDEIIKLNQKEIATYIRGAIDEEF